MPGREPLDWSFPPTPLYYQIASVLRNGLGTTWKTGDQLPSEQDLAREFEVSVGTMRRAIQILVQEGYLSRHQGKGTIVRRPIFGTNQLRLTGSLLDLMQFEPSAQVKLISRRVVVPPPEIRLTLNLRDEEKAGFFRRLIHIDRKPLAYLEAYVLARYDPAIPTSDLARSPIVSILGRGGVQISRCEQSIGAEISTAAIAKVLRVPLGFPVLYISRTYSDASGTAVLCSTGAYRGDMYRYVALLEPGRGL